MTYKVFSQPNCARCPAVKNFMLTTGISGEEINALDRIPECAELGISSTPTVLFFGDSGEEIGRAYDIPSVKAFLEKSQS